MSNAFRGPCAQWASYLAALHPDDLSASERAALLAHLATCEACAAAVADYHLLAGQLGRLPDRATQQTLPPQLQALWDASPARKECEDG